MERSEDFSKCDKKTLACSEQKLSISPFFAVKISSCDLSAAGVIQVIGFIGYVPFEPFGGNPSSLSE